MGLADKNIDEFTENSSGVDEVVRRHKKRISEASFLKYKKLIFVTSIILGFFVVMSVYFFSDNSKVKSIAVEGNDYLDSGYIKELSGLNLESRYYFTVWFLVENRLNKDPLIAKSNVSYEANNVIKLKIYEKKPVGYRYTEQAEIVLSNGETVVLTSEMLDIVSRIPLITGFEDEQQLRLLTKALNSIDKNAIENISELEQYNMQYDPNAIKLYLRDGNYIFASYYSLELLNDYNAIASKFVGNGHCIFLDDGLEVAYKRVCPWDEVVIEKEYWQNENGEFILNKYGDRVVKHYYTDENGEFLLDEIGNKIPIPIDEFGEEITLPAQSEQEDAPIETPSE